MSSFETGPQPERKESSEEQEIENFLEEANIFGEAAIRMSQALQEAVHEMVAEGMPLTEEAKANVQELQETLDGLTGEKGAQERERLRTYITNLSVEERASKMELVRRVMQRAQEAIQQQINEIKELYTPQKDNNIQ